jgi:hypothetical protein
VVLSPVDDDVDRELTALLVVDRPVESEVTLLTVVLATEYNCEPLIASVLVAETRPAARFVRVRSEPAAPMLTVLDGVVPAKPP